MVCITSLYLTEKSYTKPQQATSLKTRPLPNNWYTQFIHELAKFRGINAATLKTKFNYHFESTYTNKEIIASLKEIYQHWLANQDSLTQSDKAAICDKIMEGLDQCSQGVHSRLREIVIGFNLPQTLDDILLQLRRSIIDYASALYNENVHSKTQFHNLAATSYGVPCLNRNDMWANEPSLNGIIEKSLYTAFQTKYTPFAIAYNVFDVIYSSIHVHYGYNGLRENAPFYTTEQYARFLPFIQKILDIPDEEQYEYLIWSGEPQESEVRGLDWKKIKQRLFLRLLHEEYYTFPQAEYTTLQNILEGESELNFMPLLNGCLKNSGELVHFLRYFIDINPAAQIALLKTHINTPGSPPSKRLIHLFNEVQNDQQFTHILKEHILPEYAELIIDDPEFINVFMRDPKAYLQLLLAIIDNLPNDRVKYLLTGNDNHDAKNLLELSAEYYPQAIEKLLQVLNDTELFSPEERTAILTKKREPSLNNLLHTLIKKGANQPVTTFCQAIETLPVPDQIAFLEQENDERFDALSFAEYHGQATHVTAILNLIHAWPEAHNDDKKRLLLKQNQDENDALAIAATLGSKRNTVKLFKTLETLLPPEEWDTYIAEHVIPLLEKLHDTKPKSYLVLLFLSLKHLNKTQQKTYLTQYNTNGLTPLMFAAYTSKKAVIATLDALEELEYSKKAFLNFLDEHQNPEQMNALMLAAQHNPEAFVLLLETIDTIPGYEPEKAALITQLSHKGMNTLILASSHHPNTVQTLLKINGRLALENRSKLFTPYEQTTGLNPLMIALEKNIEIAPAILEASSPFPKAHIRVLTQRDTATQKNALMLAASNPTASEMTARILDHIQNLTVDKVKEPQAKIKLDSDKRAIFLSRSKDGFDAFHLAVHSGQFENLPEILRALNELLSPKQFERYLKTIQNELLPQIQREYPERYLGVTIALIKYLDEDTQIAKLTHFDTQYTPFTLAARYWPQAIKPILDALSALTYPEEQIVELFFQTTPNTKDNALTLCAQYNPEALPDFLELIKTLPEAFDAKKPAFIGQINNRGHNCLSIVARQNPDKIDHVFDVCQTYLTDTSLDAFFANQETETQYNTLMIAAEKNPQAANTMLKSLIKRLPKEQVLAIISHNNSEKNLLTIAASNPAAHALCNTIVQFFLEPSNNTYALTQMLFNPQDVLQYFAKRGIQDSIHYTLDLFHRLSISLDLYILLNRQFLAQFITDDPKNYLAFTLTVLERLKPEQQSIVLQQEIQKTGLTPLTFAMRHQPKAIPLILETLSKTPNTCNAVIAQKEKDTQKNALMVAAYHCPKFIPSMLDILPIETLKKTIQEVDKTKPDLFLATMPNHPNDRELLLETLYSRLNVEERDEYAQYVLNKICSKVRKSDWANLCWESLNRLKGFCSPKIILTFLKNRLPLDNLPNPFILMSEHLPRERFATILEYLKNLPRNDEALYSLKKTLLTNEYHTNQCIINTTHKIITNPLENNAEYVSFLETQFDTAFIKQYAEQELIQKDFVNTAQIYPEHLHSIALISYLEPQKQIEVLTQITNDGYHAMMLAVQNQSNNAITLLLDTMSRHGTIPQQKQILRQCTHDGKTLLTLNNYLNLSILARINTLFSPEEKEALFAQTDPETLIRTLTAALLELVQSNRLEELVHLIDLLDTLPTSYQTHTAKLFQYYYDKSPLLTLCALQQPEALTLFLAHIPQWIPNPKMQIKLYESTLKQTSGAISEHAHFELNFARNLAQLQQTIEAYPNEETDAFSPYTIVSNLHKALTEAFQAYLLSHDLEQLKTQSRALLQPPKIVLADYFDWVDASLNIFLCLTVIGGLYLIARNAFETLFKKDSTVEQPKSENPVNEALALPTKVSIKNESPPKHVSFFKPCRETVALKKIKALETILGP